MDNTQLIELLRSFLAYLEGGGVSPEPEPTVPSPEIVNADDVDYLAMVDHLLADIPAGNDEVEHTCAHVFPIIAAEIRAMPYLQQHWHQFWYAAAHVLDNEAGNMPSKKAPWMKWLKTLRDYLADEYAEPDANVTLGEFYEGIANTLFKHGNEIYRIGKVAGRLASYASMTADALRGVRGESPVRGEDRPKDPAPPVDPDAPFSH